MDEVRTPTLLFSIVISLTFKDVIHVIDPFNFVVPETDNEELHVILL